MKFNCGWKSLWIPILPAIVVAIVLPLLLRKTHVEEPKPPVGQAPPVAAPTPPSPPVPPPTPKFPGSPTSSDPVLGRWQTAIRVRDANGVMSAQSAFLEREEEYREKLVAMAKEDADPRIRAFTVAALGRMKAPPPESFFVERLDDASEHPRVSALQALEKIGTGACLSKVDALASSDPAAGVRSAAAQTAKAVRSR